MENRNFSDIGRDIGKAVKDAIHSNEFSELKHTVKDAVNTAKQTVKEAAAPQKGRYTSGKSRPAYQKSAEPAYSYSTPVMAAE